MASLNQDYDDHYVAQSIRGGDDYLAFFKSKKEAMTWYWYNQIHTNVIESIIRCKRSLIFTDSP